MRRVCILFFAIISCAAFAQGEKIADMQAAREWCDRTMTHRIEGIWEFPDDHTRVLIRRDDSRQGRYDIVAIESEDTRILPGESIGYLQESALPEKFEMGLFRSRRAGVLSELGKCLAELNDSKDALLVKGREIKFSLNTRWLLPSFWRIIRIGLKDPLESLPKGLVRIYPAKGHRQPDYL